MDWLEDVGTDDTSQRDLARLETELGGAGYREGIEAGKEARLQEGFDAGFRAGVRAGLELGLARGTLRAWAEAAETAGAPDAALAAQIEALAREGVLLREHDDPDAAQTAKAVLDAAANDQRAPSRAAIDDARFWRAL